MMTEEAKNLRDSINFFHLKHKEYADLVQMHTCSRSIDESEIKRLEGLWDVCPMYFLVLLNLCFAVE